MNVKNCFFSICVFLVLSSAAISQSKNAFLNRAYWKKHPSIETIKSTMKDGNDLSELDKNQFDPVVFAIIEKNPTETILFLLENENNGVNKITHDKRTYLFWAAYSSNLSLVEALLEKGAKTDLLDEHGNTAMLFAASNGLTDKAIYECLIKNGADVLTEKTTSGANVMLCVAPYLNDLTLIDYFTKLGLSIHATDDNGNGLFNYAARNGNQSLLDQLIALKVAYKTLNKEGGNAFVFACQGSRSKSNNVAFYSYLTSLGINPNFTTNSGMNALHILAGRTIDLAVINYFIDQEVNINQADKDGNTPFLIAVARQKNDEIIQVLASKVEDFNHVNKDGESALMLALQSGTDVTVKYLFSKNATRNTHDAKGNGFAYYLCQSYDRNHDDSFTRKMELLQQHNIDIYAIQQNGNSIYHNIATLNNDLLLSELSLSSKGINQINNDGMAPIHISALNASNDSILRHLLELGADKTVTTEFGETAYDLASENELLKSNNVSIEFLK